MIFLKQLPIFFFLSIFVTTMNAQVSVNGQIDIRIDIPDIIIGNPSPRKQPAPRERPVVIVTERVPAPKYPEYEESSYGTVVNQNNGPRFDYQVVNASVVQRRNYHVDLILHLDTGDVMTIAMQEANDNDYNFHFYKRPNRHNNSIYDIRLNKTSIPINSAAVSLQPQRNGSYKAVLNLHSSYDGNFNGTVNNIY